MAFIVRFTHKGKGRREIRLDTPASARTTVRFGLVVGGYDDAEAAGWVAAVEAAIDHGTDAQWRGPWRYGEVSVERIPSDDDDDGPDFEPDPDPPEPAWLNRI